MEKQLVKTFTRTVTNFNAPPFLSFRRLKLFLLEIIIILFFEKGKNAKKVWSSFHVLPLRCVLFLTCHKKNACVCGSKTNNGYSSTNYWAHTFTSFLNACASSHSQKNSVSKTFQRYWESRRGCIMNFKFVEVMMFFYNFKNQYEF